MDEHPTDHPFVDHDESLTDEADSPRPRRRWLIAVVSIVVVVVAIGAVLFVAATHYQPLSQSLGGGYAAQVLTSDGSLAVNRITNAQDNTVVWTEPRGTFHLEVVFTINNDQRFGVTIDKVMAPPNPSGNSNVQVFFDSKGNGMGVYGYKGGPVFHPTTLASKGELELAVHWDQQCVPASAVGGATTYTSMPVEYSFMGIRHTVDVPIPALTIGTRSTC